MLFNSFEFAIFLPIVFFIYWILLKNSIKGQNLFLLVASYVFYGWWDWRFLFLIILSSIADFTIGIQLSNQENAKRRRFLLFMSLIINLGLLGFFKYFNFFIDSFQNLSNQFGLSFHKRSLNIILPVGISFYTFQTLSYTIDIYRKKIEPTRDIVAFFAFVSFFPQLVAGPIERAKNLLPQFLHSRQFHESTTKDGLRQILWGLFKKIVIADFCARDVDYIFTNYQTLSGTYLFLGALYFAFQIYCDFSGYSDIAIGTSKLFGFRLMTNFSYPYFSKNIAEFWKRWHISLSTWFRDYVYIPMGGSHCGKWSQVRNILLTFTVSGLWHGANWTFVFWGFLNGLYYLPKIFIGQNTFDQITRLEALPISRLKPILQVAGTFLLTLIAWIFFRAPTIGDAFSYIHHMLFRNLWIFPDRRTEGLIAIVILLIIEGLQRHKKHGLQIEKMHVTARWGIYYTMIFLIFLFFKSEQTFIYFQF